MCSSSFIPWNYFSLNSDARHFSPTPWAENGLRDSHVSCTHALLFCFVSALFVRGGNVSLLNLPHLIGCNDNTIYWYLFNGNMFPFLFNNTVLPALHPQNILKFREGLRWRWQPWCWFWAEGMNREDSGIRDSPAVKRKVLSNAFYLAGFVSTD